RQPRRRLHRLGIHARGRRPGRKPGQRPRQPRVRIHRLGIHAGGSGPRREPRQRPRLADPRGPRAVHAVAGGAHGAHPLSTLTASLTEAKKRASMRTPVRALTQLAAAALLASAISAQAQPAGVNASRILIGQSAPLTGANAELGNDIRNGALAYFRKVNEAGGVHGRKIELVSLDDANQVPKAEANTRKLLEEDGVFALFGYASATLSRPALPFVEKHK